MFIFLRNTYISHWMHLWQTAFSTSQNSDIACLHIHTFCFQGLWYVLSRRTMLLILVDIFNFAVFCWEFWQPSSCLRVRALRKHAASFHDFLLRMHLPSLLSVVPVLVFLSDTISTSSELWFEKIRILTNPSDKLSVFGLIRLIFGHEY